MFELDGVTDAIAREALVLGAAKLPIKTRIVTRHRLRREQDEARGAMKAEEFEDMSLDQLDDQLDKLKKEQFNLRFQRASGQLENTSRVREVRRDIARIMTVARAEAMAGGAKGASKE